MTQSDNIGVLFYLKKESIVLCLQLENDATIFCSKYSFRLLAIFLTELLNKHSKLNMFA